MFFKGQNWKHVQLIFSLDENSIFFWSTLVEIFCLKEIIHVNLYSKVNERWNPKNKKYIFTCPRCCCWRFHGFLMQNHKIPYQQLLIFQNSIFNEHGRRVGGGSFPHLPFWVLWPFYIIEKNVFNETITYFWNNFRQISNVNGYSNVKNA